eukprot:73419-Amphidinium_carterae.1
MSDRVTAQNAKSDSVCYKHYNAGVKRLCWPNSRGMRLGAVRVGDAEDAQARRVATERLQIYEVSDLVGNIRTCHAAVVRQLFL